MIYFFVPEQKIFGIRGIKLAKIFVWLDVLSFLTQVGGGIMISPGGSYKTLMLGIHIYMVSTHIFLKSFSYLQD